MYEVLSIGKRSVFGKDPIRSREVYASQFDLEKQHAFLPPLSKRMKRNKQDIDSSLSGSAESAISSNDIDIQINMSSQKQFIAKMVQFIALIKE